MTNRSLGERAAPRGMRRSRSKLWESAPGGGLQPSKALLWEPTPEVVARNQMWMLGALSPACALTEVLASAKAFGLAIDALPVGKDIRARLTMHLEAHIAALEVLRYG